MSGIYRRDAHALCVLVVDDEPIIRENIASFLEDEDFVVREAGSSEQALAILDRENVDIGIVDIRLPGIDGNAFIQAAHRVKPAMKFLIHTGSVEYCLPAELRALGISDEAVLRKPIGNMDMLLEAIATLIEDSGSILHTSEGGNVR